MGDDIIKSLSNNSQAKQLWDKLPPSHQNEYLKWINQAKRPETRAKRIAKTLEMLIQKKP
jgi:uncharacterized protein YdeI (YjbR/CyaY-like superfamily)